MLANGKLVICTSEVDEEGYPISQTVDRVVCLLGMRAGCPTCQNSQVEVLFQIRPSDQVVACPQWDNETERVKEKSDPTSYSLVRREVCLTQKPFPFCCECPNSRATEMPQSLPKW